MEKMVKKMVQTGYGLGMLSVRQARKVASGVKQELGLNEEESLRLAKELVHSSQSVSRDVLGTVQKYVEGALVHSKIVNKHELNVVKQRLRKRIRGLGQAEKETIFSKLKRKVKKR